MSLSKRFHIIYCLCLTVALLSAGCVSKPAEEVATAIENPVVPLEEYPGAVYEAGDEAYPGGYYIHTVSLPDESISIIAKWFIGDLLQWETLAKCNPTINPNRIFLGNKIRIPRSIMTRHTPMTPEFVAESQPQAQRKKTKKSSLAKTKTTQVEPKSPAVDDENILFGPKGYSKED